MSKLEELIQKLCPDGVEYKKLGDVLDTCTDYTAAGSFADIAKNVQYLPEPDYALLVRTMDIKSKFTKGKLVFVNKHAYEYLWRVHMDSNCIILPNIGANCGEVYYIQVKDLPDIPCVLGPNAILGRSTECNLKYVFYCLNGHDFQRKLAAIISPGGQTKYNKTNLKMLEIPVPPLPVQEEIVRLLDDFTAKTAELQDELNKEYEARKKQYEYYRDSLLNVDLNNYRKVKDVFTRLRGTPITASKMKEIMDDNGDIKIFAGGKTIVNAFEKDIPNPNITRVPAVLVQSRGVIDVVYYDSPFTFKNEMWAYTHENKITLKYLYYVLKNNLKKFRQEASGMGSMPQISLKVTEDLEIPIPSIETQQKIVDILDACTLAVLDIQSELLSELESRQKQYEFYRDKLLTFKELK